MHFNTFFYPHVFSQIILNNNFQFLNTRTNRPIHAAPHKLSISISLRYPIFLHFFFPKLCILLCEQTNPFIFLKPKDRVESAALSSPIALHTPPHKLSSTHPFSATQHKHANFFFFFFQFQIFTYILYKKKKYKNKNKTKRKDKNQSLKN